MNKIILMICIICAFTTITTFGQKGTMVEKEIKFAKGKNSATVSGVIKDRLDSHLFHIGANAGQTLTVTMTSPKPLKDAYLCVTFPGGKADEIFCGKRKYVLQLPTNGDYEMHIEAIREPIPYKITVSIK